MSDRGNIKVVMVQVTKEEEQRVLQLLADMGVYYHVSKV